MSGADDHGVSEITPNGKHAGLLSSPLFWYWLVAGSTWLVVYWVCTWPWDGVRFDSDYWEHSAAIAEWTRHLWAPQNPHLPIETGSPRYMPYFFVLAATARLFDLDPFQALALGAGLNMGLLAVGVLLFFRHYFRSAWAPLVGFIALVACWGIPWSWSNVLQLQVLLSVAPFPSTFSFSLGLFAFWLASRAMRGAASHAHYLLLALIVAICLVSHALTGAFIIGSIGIMALVDPAPSWKTQASILGATAIGAILVELWPLFSTWQVILGVSGGEDSSWVESGQVADQLELEASDQLFYSPFLVLIGLGPALAGLPALFLMLKRRQHLFIPFGFLAMLAPYLVNLYRPIPLGHRFLIFAAIFLQLGVVWWVLQTAPAWRAVFVQRETRLVRSKPVLMLLSVGILLVGLNLAMVARKISLYNLFSNEQGWHQVGSVGPVVDKMQSMHGGFRPVRKHMERIASHLTDDAVVMAQAHLAWPLPTFRGKVVSLLHWNPMVRDDLARQRAVARFFEPDTSNAERMGIAQGYGVTHVLYENSWSAAIAEELKKLGTIVYQDEDYTLLILEPPAPLS